MARKAARNAVLLAIVLALTSLYLLFVLVDDYAEPLPIKVVARTPAQLPIAQDYQRAKEAVREQVLFKANLAISKGLTYGSDGIVRGWERLHKQFGKAGRERDEQHPIEQLIYRGKRRWEALLKRQSKDLASAVRAYEKRYFRAPPRGFDAWFRFCTENNVRIIDDYDQIEKDIGPWFGIAPDQFRQRVKDLENFKHSYKITLHANGTSTLTGDRASFPRAQMQYDMIAPLASIIGSDLSLHVSDHDRGNAIISEELRELLLSAAGRGSFVTEAELAKHENDAQASLGIQFACSPSSLARRISIWRPQPALNDEAMGFIYDVREDAQMNFCNNPKLLRYHGAFSYPFARRAGMRPMFQLSKTAHNHEFKMPPLEGFDLYEGKRYRAVPWEAKNDSRLFWRGTMTGDAYTQPQKGYRPHYNWRESHRIRLSFLVAPTKQDGKEDEDRRWLWVRRGDEWSKASFPHSILRKNYFDIGLIDKLHQCDEADGTCAQMQKELRFKSKTPRGSEAGYKYLLDVDGNGWSSRFRRLLGSGSVVLKSTIYPEWNTDWLVPFYHYVPVRNDYSDLVEIMAFFTGTPGTGDESKTDGRDDLGRQIGMNARRFVAEHWRWQDMQAYMLRLLLEYRRLMADDREREAYE